MHNKSTKKTKVEKNYAINFVHASLFHCVIKSCSILVNVNNCFVVKLTDKRSKYINYLWENTLENSFSTFFTMQIEWIIFWMNNLKWSELIFGLCDNFFEFGCVSSIMVKVTIHLEVVHRTRNCQNFPHSTYYYQSMRM